MNFLFKEERLTPDDNCLICKGNGHMQFKGHKTICECIVRKKVKEYLGSLYAEMPYSSLDGLNIKNKSLCFEGCLMERFKSLVKSFLLYNQLKLTHMSVLPDDIIQYYVTNGDEAKQKFRELSEVDFLVIYFDVDPPNRLYGEMIESILKKRIMFDRFSWLYFVGKYSEFWFTDRYSNALREYLDKNFVKFTQLNKFKFNKGIRK